MYIIASFRSRSQAIKFSSSLSRNGIRNNIITTPREVSASCGVSVKFSSGAYSTANKIFINGEYSSFVGFYKIINNTYGREEVAKL